MPSTAMHVLMSGLIDYAGLFPPAKLGMAAAVDKYAAYLRCPHAWMLGRFICPASRLEEFRSEAHRLLPTALPVDGSSETEPKPWEEAWRLSVIVDGDLNENLDTIFAFNHEHENPKKGLANIDAVELKAPSVEFIDKTVDEIPEELFPFFEIPLSLGAKTADVRGFVACLAGTDAAAKIRTGGLTPDAIPTPEAIAEFLIAAAAADVPFKATAGLHHPIRGEYPLTYEPNCPKGVMHGFVNFFLAAAFARAGKSADEIVGMLKETSLKAVQAGEKEIRWRNSAVEVEQLAETRDLFALSYGSCSFEEPLEELKAPGLV